MYVDQSKIHPTEHFKKVGQNAQYKCDSHTSEITEWSFEDGPLPQNANGNGNKLTITGITIQNEGRYECIGDLNRWFGKPKFAAIGSLNLTG